MKTKLTALALAGSMMIFSPSCSTTYDAYGRPVQSVDPGVATAGVLAAGVLGYALANRDDDHRYYRGRPHYGHHRGHYRHYRGHHRSYRY